MRTVFGIFLFSGFVKFQVETVKYNNKRNNLANLYYSRKYLGKL